MAPKRKKAADAAPAAASKKAKSSDAAPAAAAAKKGSAKVDTVFIEHWYESSCCLSL